MQKWLKFYFDSFFVKKYQASVALLSRHEVSETYGHFIRDVIGAFYQLKLANITPDFYILPLNTPFQAQMYELLGIPRECIIPSCPKNTLIQAKQLIIPTLMADYEIVEYRRHLHFRSFLMPLFVYKMYDDLLPNNIIPKRKIFLVRPHNSNRSIENQTEVEYVFKNFGYEIILPDTMNIKEQIYTFASATHIGSMHGSALVNIAFCKKNTRIFEIFSQYYHDPAQCYMALARGCKYSYMVGETHDTSMHPQQENVYINPEKLKLALQIFEQE
ncbi:glycosyltransferase family 61 protein [Helicobacter labetoulli]|uniref:glycosyltransferase family 61 protein n=1 Tax=Helicobacter labetoulli TaxID=2315333 RepID=UPI001FC9B044|nr:glycosyltransferase family 61 protein [Helicobacter labetoulli]